MEQVKITIDSVIGWGYNTTPETAVTTWDVTGPDVTELVTHVLETRAMVLANLGGAYHIEQFYHEGEVILSQFNLVDELRELDRGEVDEVEVTMGPFTTEQLERIAEADQELYNEAVEHFKSLGVEV